MTTNYDFPIVEDFHRIQANLIQRHLTREGQNSVLVAGRGLGKSVLSRGIVYLNALNYKGIIPPRSKTKLFNIICMPQLNQAKKVHWAPLEYLFNETPLARLVQSINRSEAVIELKGDRPGIMLAGINQDEGKRLRGLSIPRLVIDEFSDVKAGIWASIKPAVDRCEGNCLITGTPKGKSSNFYRFTREMTSKNGWRYYHYVTADNPYLPDIDRILREARSGLTEREFRSEYLGSWEDFPGQIFDSLQKSHVMTPGVFPQFEQFFLGVDWGDVNPACCVVGVRDFPRKYYVIDSWEGNQDGSNQSISFDNFLRICGEMCNKYGVEATFPDVFQPGNINYINEFRNSQYPGLRNTVDPISEDYKRMRSLKVMPSLAQMNRLFNQNRLFINANLEDNFRSVIRKRDKMSDQFLDEVDKTACRMHRIDAARYAISNIENTLAILCGHNYSSYSAYSSETNNTDSLGYSVA